MYNLVKRQAEVEILPLAQAEQVGVISYSPLGSGLLSGKYGPGMQTEHGRLMENQMHRTVTACRRPRYRGTLRGVRAGAAACTRRRWRWRGHVAPGVTAPIIGALTRKVGESFQAAEVVMTPEWRVELSALSPEPPPATDRSEERLGISYQGAQAK